MMAFITLRDTVAFVKDGFGFVESPGRGLDLKIWPAFGLSILHKKCKKCDYVCEVFR